MVPNRRNAELSYANKFHAYDFVIGIKIYSNHGIPRLVV